MKAVSKSNIVGSTTGGVLAGEVAEMANVERGSRSVLAQETSTRAS